MTATFNHPKPVVPAHLRTANRVLDHMDQALTAALRGNGTGEELAAVGQALIASVLRPRTPEEQAEEDRYDREVRAYNEAVKAWNAPIKAAQQARRNAAEVAKVRKAACPVCYATHAGEC